MRLGRMWNGSGWSAARLEVQTNTGCCIVTSAGGLYCLSVCRCGGRGTKRAPSWRAVCTCALVVLVGGLSIRPVL